MSNYLMQDRQKIKHQQAALYAARVRARAWMRQARVPMLCTDKPRWKPQPQLWLLDPNANPF